MEPRKHKTKRYKLYKRYEADFWGHLSPHLISIRKRGEYRNSFSFRWMKTFMKKNREVNKKSLWLKRNKFLRVSSMLKKFIYLFKHRHRALFFKNLRQNKNYKRKKWKIIRKVKVSIRRKYDYIKPFGLKKNKKIFKLKRNSRNKLRLNRKPHKFVLRPKFNYVFIEYEHIKYKKRKLTYKSKRYVNTLRLKTFYGRIKRKQLKRLYRESMKYNMFFSQIMLSKLETRLDVIIYRLNFFKSIDTVKQFINHKNVSVNNKLVNKCSYEVNFYDIVSIKKKHHKKLLLSLWYNLKFKYTYINYPKYMEVNYDILSCLIFRHPKLKEIPYPFYINTTKNGIKSLLYNSK